MADNKSRRTKSRANIDKKTMRAIKGALGIKSKPLVVQKTGTVIGISGNEVCLEFEKPLGRYERTYRAGQLISGGKLPALNSKVNLLTLIWVEPPQPTDISDLLAKYETNNGFPVIDKKIEESDPDKDA